MKYLNRYLLFLIIALIIYSLSISYFFNIHYPRSASPNFSNEIRGDLSGILDREKPEVIILGNSIQAIALDQDLFSNITNKKTVQFAIPGAATAQYYLLIKNVVLRSESLPKYIILFFLNNHLTYPDLNVEGDEFIEAIDEIATGNELVLIQKAYINPKNPISIWLDENILVLGERQRIKSKVDNKIKYTLPKLLLNCDKLCLDSNLDAIFISENMNQDLSAQNNDNWQGKDWTFNGRVERSFLPDILQMARENNISLILVREKDFSLMKPGAETNEMKKYFEELQAYLENNSIPLIDISHDAQLTADMFFDEVHIKESEKTIFTNLIAQSFLNSISK
jgi:hypothetical protein